MSDTPPQDAESVRTRVVWIVAAATVALSVVFVAIAWLLVERPAVPAHPVTGSSPLEDRLFDLSSGGPDAIAEGKRRLDRYEWVDRSANTIRIPIDRAIDAVVADPSLIGPHAVTEVRP